MFTELWQASIHVFELVPLRRCDVALALHKNDHDPERFLAEVDRKSVVPLAATPVTLTLLLEIYGEEAGLPSSRTELYARGCLKLCEEPNPARREASATGALDIKQRLAVATRLAALTVFSERPSIWMGPVRASDQEGQLTLYQAAGGMESVRNDSVRVDEAAIREGLQTGLFTLGKENEQGFIQHTYAEFLAARFLVERRLTAKQMLSLVVQPADPDGKLPPQLHGVAAWLAGMEPEFYRLILPRDPVVLLRSDPDRVPEAER